MNTANEFFAMDGKVCYTISDGQKQVYFYLWEADIDIAVK